MKLRDAELASRIERGTLPREGSDIKDGPNGLRWRTSNSGNVMIVTSESGREYTQRHATAAECAALGQSAEHQRKIGPPLTRDQLREVRATEAMIRADQDAPAGLTDDERDEIAWDAYDAAIEDE